MFIWQLDSNSSAYHHRAVVQEHKIHKTELRVIVSFGMHLSLTPVGVIRVLSAYGTPYTNHPSWCKTRHSH